MSGTLYSSRIWSRPSARPRLTNRKQYLLSSTALLSDLVDKGDGLSNVGFDVLRELALVAEDFGGIHTSSNKGEPFFFVPGLRYSQLRSPMTFILVIVSGLP